MRHADLLREATAGVAKPASAPCMILQCGTWYGCAAVWPCGCVFGGRMSGAIGSKNTCKTFSTEFFYPVEKVEFFDWIRLSEILKSKKVESKNTFFDCIRKPDLGFSQKRPFSTDKSDRIRNSLKCAIFFSCITCHALGSGPHFLFLFYCLVLTSTLNIAGRLDANTACHESID